MGIKNPKPMPDITIVKAADETVNNSSVLQSDDELVITLPVGKWEVKSRIFANSANNADLKVNYLTSQNVTALGTAQFINASGAVQTSVVGNYLATSGTDIAAGGMGGDNLTVIFSLTVEVTVACTLTVRWAQNTAQLSDTKVLAGSLLEATKLI